jgi:hypothetical protein
MNATFNEIKKWYIMPLSAVEIITAADNIVFGDKSDALKSTLQADSKWSFSSIVKQNDTGGEDILGFKLSATINVIQNDYNDMLASFSVIANTAITQINLYLRTNTKQTNGKVMQIVPHTADSTYVADYSISFNIDSSNDSPILIITIKAIFSINILAQTSPILFNLIS